MKKIPIEYPLNLKVIRDLHKRTTDYFIAGGMPLSLVQKKYISDTHYNDVDIWFKTPEALKIGLEYFRELAKTSNAFKDQYETKNAWTFDFSVSFQLIKNTGNIEEILNEFSYENSKMYTKFPFNYVTVYSDEPVVDLISFFIPSKNFDASLYTNIVHMKKYQRDKGLTISRDLIASGVRALINHEVIMDSFYGSETETEKDKEVREYYKNDKYFYALQSIDGFWDTYNRMYDSGEKILFLELLSDTYISSPYFDGNIRQIKDSLFTYLVYNRLPRIQWEDDDERRYKESEEYVVKNYPELLI
jgi:hypothetical protein